MNLVNIDLAEVTNDELRHSVEVFNRERWFKGDIVTFIVVSLQVIPRN